MVKLHSLSSSFVILNGSTRQIFELNPMAQLELHVVTPIKFEHRSLLSDITRDRSTIYILSDNYSTLAVWNVETRAIKYHSMQFDTDTTIEKLYALSAALVFYDTSHRIHLKYLDKTRKMGVLERADLFETAGSRLALYDRTTNKLITYDISKKLRGEIQLETTLDALCFTKDGEYLFAIGQKESLLMMYQVDNGKRLEKLFIENLSVFIQATRDYLLVSRMDEVLFMSINAGDKCLSKRYE